MSGLAETGHPGLSSRLFAATHTLSHALAAVGVGGLLLLALGTTLDVLLRYGLARPIRGYAEVVALAAAVLLAACLPQVLASRANVTVDMVGRWLGPSAKRWFDRFGAVVTAALFGAMAWQFVLFALDKYRSNETLSVLRWPVWPWWAGVALMALIAAWVGLMMVVQTWVDGVSADDAQRCDG